MSKHQTARAIMRGQTKGMINAYICPNIHVTITKNLDNGFIPERLACPDCDQISVTMMYLVNQEKFTPVIEWFKPTEGEIQAAELSMSKEHAKSHRDYVNKGGLISRPVKLPSFTG